MDALPSDRADLSPFGAKDGPRIPKSVSFEHLAGSNSDERQRGYQDFGNESLLLVKVCPLYVSPPSSPLGES